MKNDLNLVFLELHEQVWFQDVNRDTANRRQNRGNKLRTYALSKASFETESYVGCIMSKSHRSDLARFQCGVAQALEVDSYGRS